MDTKLYGAAAELWHSTDREVLCESGARTGKTHSELVKAKFTLEKYPGTRWLFVRYTRASLTESVLPDWENKILGVGHPAIGRARRDNRSAYHFPNGSVAILGGLDNTDRFLSAELDRFTLFQAEEVPDQEDWDILMSRLSGNATPYVQAIADANPSHERHWLIRRVREALCLVCASIVEGAACKRCGSTHVGRMRHLQFRHQDNPRWFDHALGRWRPEGEAYLLGVLGRLRGTKRKRLLEHQWISEEGQILDEWDDEIHRISGRLERDEVRGWLLHVTSKGWSADSKDPMRITPVPLKWFGAGADWGFFPHPAVLQIWGYDDHGRMFRVAEVYKTMQQMEWWAEVAEALWREFEYDYIAVDPSCNALREAFNRRLGARDGSTIAISADNTIRRQTPDLAGIDLMRWGLRDPQGVARTFFLRDALRYGADPNLKESLRPTCTEEEIPEWTFYRRPSTNRIEEKPDPQCDDHGLDAWRYCCGEGWGKRMAPKLAAARSAEGSLGQILRHDEKMAKARAWRQAHG